MVNNGNQLVELVKSQASIVDVISKVVKLRQSSRTWQGLCPFHSEKTPSFHVYPQQGHFYCYGCHNHGDVITFTQRFYNVGFKEALEQLATELGIDHKQYISQYPSQNIVLNLLKEAADIFHEKLLSSKKTDPHVQFLYTRKLSNRDLINFFRIGWSSSQLPEVLLKKYTSEQLIEAGLLYDFKGQLKPRFYNRVIFPIYSSNGDVIAFGGRTVPNKSLSKSKAPKYLNSPETLVFKKNQVLYGLDKVRHNTSIPWVLVVEGYIDVAQLRAYGMPAVAPMGTALTQAQYAKLAQTHKEVIFCFDGDEAGQKASFNSLLVILPSFKADDKISFVTMPDGLDPDQVLLNHGKDYFVNLCKKRVKIVEYLFSQVRKLYPKSTPDDRMRFNAKVRSLIRTIEDPDARRGFEASLFQYERESFSNRFTAKPPKLQLPKVASNIDILKALFIQNPDELKSLSEIDKKLLNYSNDTTFCELLYGNITSTTMERLQSESRVSHAKTLKLIKQDCIKSELEYQLMSYKKNLLCLSMLALSQNNLPALEKPSILLNSQDADICESASVSPGTERFERIQNKAQLQSGVVLKGLETKHLKYIYQSVVRTFC